MLAEGGNAVDACVAAAFASWVAESPLTGPGRRRLHARPPRARPQRPPARLLRRRPRARRPRRRARRDGGDRHRLRRRHDARSSGSARRRARCPGAAAGLEAAHRSYGDAALGELVEPALELARGGVELTRAAGVPARDPRPDPPAHADEGRRIYGRRARLARATGSSSPTSRDTLEQLAAQGRGRDLRRRARAASRRPPARAGGAITAADLAAYRVDPPAAGRVALPRPRVRLEPAAVVGRRPDRLRAAAARRARAAGGAGQRRRDRAARRGDARAGRARDGQLRARAATAAGSRGGSRPSRTSAPRSRRDPRGPGRRARGAPPGGTTHISVVDAAGNAASLTASTGSGSGVIVPGTGIHLNNMLGEYDLNPPGGARGPGTRLTSMMAPSIVLAPRPAAAGRRQRGLGAAARRDPADRSSTSSTTGCASRRRSTRRASTSRSRTSTARAAPTRPSSTGSRRAATTSSAGAGATSTSAASRRSRSARRRPARRGRRPAARRPRDRRRMSRALVRPAEPGDAAALVALAEAVGRGAGGLADLRRAAGASVADERRYLRAVRRHPDAAVFVAETRRRDRRPALARARPAPGEPPRRRPRADGRRRPAGEGVGRALLEQAVDVGARGRRARSSSCTSSRTTSRRSRLYERSASCARATGSSHYRRGERATSTRS